MDEGEAEVADEVVAVVVEPAAVAEEEVVVVVVVEAVVRKEVGIVVHRTMIPINGRNNVRKRRTTLRKPWPTTTTAITKPHPTTTTTRDQ